jgi:hypothetical protein
MNSGMSMIMHNTLTTKRPPTVVSGRRGDPVDYLSAVPCTSLLPVSPEVAARYPNRRPTELLQCFVPGTYDVVEGDTVVFGGKQYPVRDAAEWSLRRTSITHLILEDIKAS